MYTNTDGEMNVPKIITHGIIAFVVLITLFSSIGTIDAGRAVAMYA